MNEKEIEVELMKHLVTIEENNSFVDIKTEIDNFFFSLEHTPINDCTLQRLQYKKSEFLQFLEKEFLMQLIQNIYLLEPISQFEWQCRQDILSILCRFDMYMLQCLEQYPMEKDRLEMRDRNLRNKMARFSKEYDERM